MFSVISMEAFVSWMISFLIVPFIVASYLLPVLSSEWEEKVKKIIEPPTEKLFLVIYEFGHGAIWILFAVIIAAVVPMFEQINTFTQICHNGVFELAVENCGDISMRDMWTNNHIHVAQILVWLLCIGLIWIWICCLKNNESDGQSHKVLSAYYATSIIFFVGGIVQQWLTISLPKPL